ncbi:hypothetical protein KAS42_05885 [bacterium]|nr:hypothetical protein [bacterium]
MEEKRAREILGKINQLSSADPVLKLRRRVDSKILANALGVPEKKIINELEELHGRGYIKTMPTEVTKEGKFKHLRIDLKSRAEKFLRGEIEF